VDQNADSGPNQERPSVKIPDHELLRCIGRGSYGEIWLARNVMGAYRAVKVVFRSSFKDGRPFERELSGIRKYEPISRSHEKFIDILQIGINKEQDYFYYIMELGDDCATGQAINPDSYLPKTLTRALNSGRKLSFAECLDLGLSLSQALVELHKHGLVHRDIKPSNIIFVNGVAKLADIGLVADVSEARSFVGTEGYIPPEGPGSPGADVFGLGKVLYEASTGKDRLEFPELPTLLGPSDDHDRMLELNEVILQACQGDARKRYADAWEMYSDLLVIADGKSVKRLRFLERRFAQFKRVAAITAAAAVISAGILYHFYRERLNAREARQRQVGVNVTRGIQAIDSWDLTAALPAFANAIALDEGDPQQAALHRFMFANVLALCPKPVQVLSTTGEVSRVQFSPDGEQILIVNGGRVRIFDLVTGPQPVQSFEAGTNVRDAAYSPDGKLVATVGSTNLNLFRVDNGSKLLSLHDKSAVRCACFNPDGSRIVAGCADGAIVMWDAQTGSRIFRRKAHDGPIRCVAFSTDRRKFVSTSEDAKARIWNAQGELFENFIQCSSPVTHANFSPNGGQLVLATQDHDAYVRDMSDTNHFYLRHRLRHGDLVNYAQFSPDGRFILTAANDHTARLWSAETYEPRYPIGILRHNDRVISASFSPDSRRIATGSRDGTVYIWDLAGSTIMPELVHGRYSPDGTRFITFTNGAAEVINSASGALLARLDVTNDSQIINMTKDGRFLLSCATNGRGTGAGCTLSVWNCEAGKLISPPLQITNSFIGAVLSGNGQRFVIFSDKQVQVWEASGTNRQSRTFEHQPANRFAFFNGDGTRLVTGGDTFVRVWDVLNGREIFECLKHRKPVLRAQFSPDETQLLTYCQDETLDKCDAQLWDAQTGRPLFPPFEHGDGVLWASFSPDGKKIVTVCEDHSASVWSTADGRRICPPLLHDGSINRAMFSSDSKKIVTASEDSTARVWDAETGDPLTPPLEHFIHVKRASFLPGDDKIVTFTEDETWVWRLPTEKRRLHDVLGLSQLLSGQPLGSSVSSPEPPAALWNRLRAGPPEPFRVTRNQVVAWEQYSARDCKRHHYWRGAVSHWKRLSELYPADEQIKTSLRAAEDEKKAHPGENQ
jgi:WD40 repeat protein